jgi:lipid-A-disaccharide synthase-like uncharacterized protein
MHMNAETIWELVGWVGQFFFGGRFLIQWIATERRKKSVVPTAFWYFSIIGSLIMLTYSIHLTYSAHTETHKGLPLIAGFSLNMIVYLRNLYFIHRRPAAAVTEDSNHAE